LLVLFDDILNSFKDLLEFNFFSH